MKHLSLFFILLILSSCSSSSLDDFYEEGQAISKTLLKELRQIRTREELVVAAPRITELHHRLVETMITAQEYRTKHPRAELASIYTEESRVSGSLRDELNRIYRFEGARELMEACQEEAMNTLDVYEKMRDKKRLQGLHSCISKQIQGLIFCTRGFCSVVAATTKKGQNYKICKSVAVATIV